MTLGRRVHVSRRSGPDLLERALRVLERHFLMLEHRRALLMRLRDSLRRSCHPFDSAGVIAVLCAISAAIDGLSTCRRPLSRQLQPVEHAAFGFVALAAIGRRRWPARSEEHTSELQSLMRISYAVFC